MRSDLPLPRFPAQRGFHLRSCRFFVRASADASLLSSSSLRVLAVSSQIGDWVLPKLFLSLVVPVAIVRGSLRTEAKHDGILIARKPIHIGRHSPQQDAPCRLRVRTAQPIRYRLSHRRRQYEALRCRENALLQEEFSGRENSTILGLN